MKFLKPLVLAILLVGLLFLLNKSNSVGSTTLPPIGKFLSPYTGFAQNIESTSDLVDGTFRFPSLKNNVTVIYDNNLVPHIYAENNMDAAYMQGYVQAQHRLWQIDITTRSAGGRLSEIMGPRALKTDKLQRRKGMVAGAMKNLEKIEKDPEAIAYLDKFIEGVNYYIEHLHPKDYPIEFKLLNYKPEAYSRLKYVLYLKQLESTLNARETDLESTNTKAWLGEQVYQEIYPEYNPAESPIIPTSVEFDYAQPHRDTINPEFIGAILPHQPFAKSPEGIGSNNWALHGSKTKNGNPIVCNDPHLSLTLPSVWYEVHIHTKEINVYGVTLPGSPGVIIGFNEDIAWGMTNVGQDVADWYRINWVDDQKQFYWLDGQKEAVDQKVESYVLPSGSVIYDTIKWTHWGPIVHENEAHPFLDLAYKWLPHNAPNNNQVRVFLDLSRAKNYEDYIAALAYFGSPGQNVVFGSTEGDVAIQVTGKFPIRSKDHGKFVMDGSSSENDWKGFIPYEHNAKVKNPTRGFVSSANQRSTGLKYPYAYHGGFADYRGRTINKLLGESEGHTVESMMKLQNDISNLRAEESLPLLLKYVDAQEKKGAQEKFYENLVTWDYQYDSQSKTPIYFEIWLDEFYQLTWDEMFQKRSDMVVKMPEVWFTIDMLKNQPDHAFFDIDSTESKENARSIVQLSFERMVKRAEKLDDEHWGDYASLDINHMARIPAFSRKAIETSGHGNSINAISGNRGHGPSWRMIVELAKNNIMAYGIFPGGQSGNPGSKYYDNNIDMWTRGEYRELLFNDQDDWSSDQILYHQNFDHE